MTATAPGAARSGAAAPPVRQRQTPPRHFNFSTTSLRELATATLPSGPVTLLPQGWTPAASSSYAGELHRTTIDLGLRREFSGHTSALLGARITVLDCINIDNAGRFAFGNGGSKVHGLVGFSYRY